jgi:hypothetical protein
MSKRTAPFVLPILCATFALGACAGSPSANRADASGAGLANAEQRRCETITGNTAEDCRRGRVAAAGPAAQGTPADIRGEARRYYASPRARCDSVTSNRRLDCLQTYGLRD